MCATACFDIGYKVSDICDDEGDTAHCSRYLLHCRSRSVYVYNVEIGLTSAMLE